MLGGFIRVHLPIVTPELSLQLQLENYSHELTPTKKSGLHGLKISGQTSNYLPGLFCGYDLPIDKMFTLFFKVGGGYQYQSTEITGEVKDSFNNGFAFVGIGAEFVYKMNKSIEIALGLQSLLQMEDSVYTTLNQVLLGVNFKL